MTPLPEVLIHSNAVITKVENRYYNDKRRLLRHGHIKD